MFATNKKYVIKKKIIERQKKLNSYYDSDTGEIVGFYIGSGRAGMNFDERGFYKPYSYNDASCRKECNTETRSKIKQRIKEAKDIDELEDIDLPQNGEYKKKSDYTWMIF